MICPKLSFNKEAFVRCLKKNCVLYNPKYGCMEAYSALCDIKEFEENIKIRKTLEKQLKVVADVAIV